MEINYIEWFGYLASFVVLVSIIMSSIIKLRWINLTGSLMFAFYGLVINSLPVAFMNTGIAFVNIYYLIKIYNSKEYFQILPISKDSKYFESLMKFYHHDIKNYFSHEDFTFDDKTIGIYILRDMVPAGIFLAEKTDEHTLSVELDFALPAYRDFKIGKYIYEKHNQFFLDKGFDTFIAKAKTDKHHKYLKKMGFEKKENNEYLKKLR
ncbi:MAG: hypothetical protein U9Q80_00620 [Bacillota bacterium]|nr:hypothetical protein [Bacillota bacterium]